MGMSLWQLLQAALLFTNAFAILNEDRFLKRCEQLKTTHNEPWSTTG